MQKSLDDLNANQRKHLAAYLSPDRDLYWYDGRVMAALCRKGLLKCTGKGEWAEKKGIRTAWKEWQKKQKETT